MWWKKDNQKVSYVSYQVDQTEVMVGPRLDRRGCGEDFFNSVSAWLVVTESYIEYPITANVRWFPWKENLEPLPDHALFGSLKMLNYWINDLKLPRVYIHCDLGSHRAPSIFGAFLFAFYQAEQSEIVSKRVVIKPEHSPIIGSDGQIHGDPIQYFKTYLDEVPLMETMAKTIVDNPEAPLDAIVRMTFERRPLALYTPEELKVYEAEQAEIEKNKRIKEWLSDEGFSFTSEPAHVSIFNAETPYGKSHVIGDRFFPEMLGSLNKYQRVIITSKEGLEVLQQKIPEAIVKESKTKDDLTFYLIEMDLTNYAKE